MLLRSSAPGSNLSPAAPPICSLFATARSRKAAGSVGDAAPGRRLPTCGAAQSHRCKRNSQYRISSVESNQRLEIEHSGRTDTGGIDGEMRVPTGVVVALGQQARRPDPTRSVMPVLVSSATRRPRWGFAACPRRAAVPQSSGLLAWTAAVRKAAAGLPPLGRCCQSRPMRACGPTRVVGQPSQGGQVQAARPAA